jgi:glutathione S-transferase
MTTLHINGWTPPAIAIAIALHEKSVAFDLAEHAWQDSATALAAFAGQLEPFNSLEGEFPLLVDGDGAINDSYFILEYLDDRYPHPPLRPADAFGQWEVQALARFFGERALPALSSLGVAQAKAKGEWPSAAVTALAGAGVLTEERRAAWRDTLTRSGDEAVTAESARKIGLLFERLDKVLADHAGPWLLGQHFTLTDIAAFVLVDPFLSGQLFVTGAAPSAALRDWHNETSQRDSVKAVLTNIEPTFLPGPEHARWG